VTSILAWNKRVFVSGAGSGAGQEAALGARNNALLDGMVYVRISELAKFRHLTVQNKEETPDSVLLWNVGSLNIVEFSVPRSSE
jgi:hypothetical protein